MNEPQKTKLCPFCQSIIDRNAVICVKCGKQLPKRKNGCLSGCLISFAVVIAIIILIGILVPDDEANTQTVISNTESVDESLKEEQKLPKDMTEEEYKTACKEIFYDEMFFGDEDLEGKLVKVHLMLSEKKYFKIESLTSSSTLEKIKEYELYRDFFECCVLREGTNSYVGMQITTLFSQKNGINPNFYKTGEKITVYAEVISWGNRTMDGYNNVTIIPKYVE